MSGEVVQLRPRDAGGMVPPNDLDAERGVLSVALTHARDVRDQLAELSPRDFFDPLNARVFHAVERAIEADEQIDADWIARKVQGSTPAVREQVFELALAPGSRATLARDVAIVRERAAIRRAIASLQQTTANLYDTRSEAWRDTVAACVADITTEPGTAATTTRIADIFEGELPDPDWIVPSLQLCPGRPNAIVGYSGQGKTLLAYALGLAVASGRPVWREHRVPRRRRVLVVDLEQGRTPTLRRLRRIARAMRLDARDLRGWLQAEVFPKASLLAEGASRMLEQLTESFDLVIFDSLKKMISGADENSAEVEAYTRKLLEVSEKTGRTFLVLIHTGKTSPDRMELETVRGSSAIVGDLGSTFLVAREPETGLLKLAHVKASVAADGGRLEPVHVELVDVAQGDDPKAGLDVRVVCEEELAERKAKAEREARTQADHAEAIRRSMDDVAPLVLELVRQKPGVLLTVVTAQINRRRELVRGTIDTLINEGALHVRSRPALGGGKMLFPGRAPEEGSLTKSVPTSGTNLGAREPKFVPPMAPPKGGANGAGTNFRRPAEGPKRQPSENGSGRPSGQTSGQSFDHDEPDLDEEHDS